MYQRINRANFSGAVSRNSRVMAAEIIIVLVSDHDLAAPHPAASDLLCGGMKWALSPKHSLAANSEVSVVSKSIIVRTIQMTPDAI